MPRIAAILIAFCLLVVPSTTSAQHLELGATIGSGTTSRQPQTVRALQASLWWADRIETAFRVAWLPLPPAGPTGYFVGCGPAPSSTCQPERVDILFAPVSPRRFVAGELIYHFRRGHRLRPFAGGGYGRMDTSEDVSCAIPGCEAVINPTPDFRWGRRTSSASDPIGVVGGSYALTPHLIVRGVLHVHRLGGEELSLTEKSIGIGFRF